MGIIDHNDGYRNDRRRRQPRDWGWMVAYGVLLAAIGAMASIEPIATGLATGLFLAAILFAGGLFAIAAGITAKGWQSRWLDIAVGLLSLLFGAAIVYNPFLGAFSLVWATGLWLAMCGCMEISAARAATSHRRWLTVLGLIDILLGVYLFLTGPVYALLILAVIVGVSFLVRGLFLIVLGLRLRMLR